ncbi:hypothetical protein [Ruegeria sp.]|uniref:hypothetical protein n=1 Tax=Ruegeria sp. TaxID=1879320 RepID=UPI003B009679
MTGVLSDHRACPAPAQDTDGPGRASGTCVQMALPGPALPQPVSMTSRGGIRLVAGLTWQVVTGPELPCLKTDAPLVLRLNGLRAQIDRSGGDSASTSLLLALAAGLVHDLPEAAGTWIFLAGLPRAEGAPETLLAMADLSRRSAEHEEGAITERVSPRAGPEALFDDPGDLLAAIRNHLGTTEIGGIALCRAAGSDAAWRRLSEGLAAAAPDIACHDVSPRAEGVPVFSSPPRIPSKALGLAGLGGTALCAGIFILVPFVQSIFAPPPPPPVPMADMRIEAGAFARICQAALAGWWPRSVGWELGNSGCALTSHLPATLGLPDPGRSDRLFEPMLVWAQFTPAVDRNPVLARAAAAQVLRAWPGEAQLEGGRLILWRVEPLPVTEAGAAGVPAPAPDQAARQLADAFAEAPGAVKTGETGVSVTPPSGTATGDLFARSAGVPRFDPVRFIRSGKGEETLYLAPVTTRQVPASLLDPNRSEDTP